MTLLLLLAGVGGEAAPTPGSGVYLPSADGRLIFEVSESPTFSTSQVWHDLSGYIRRAEGIVIDRGRASEFDDVRAGTLDLTLDVSDGVLNPRNESSPHAGCLKVRRQCRLRLVHGGIVYPLFHGFTTGFPRVYHRPNRQGLMPFRASDGFRVMGNADPTGGLFTIAHPVYGAIGVGRIGGVPTGERLSGELITSVLDAMTWPTNLQAIAPGRVTVDAGAAPQRALAIIQAAAKAEGSEFYIDRTGKATFRDRHDRFSEPRSVTTQATFRPNRVARPSYTEPLEILFDDTRLINEAAYTGTSGVPQIQRSTTSIDEYGINDDVETLISVRDDDAMGLAVLAVDENASPTDRVEQLVVRVHSQTSFAVPAVLGRELFDRIAVVVSSTYGAADETLSAVVQGVRHVIDTTSWVSTFRLGPYHQHDFFTIEDPTLGVIEGVGAIAP